MDTDNIDALSHTTNRHSLDVNEFHVSGHHISNRASETHDAKENYPHYILLKVLQTSEADIL